MKPTKHLHLVTGILRRESIVRPTDSVVSPVERFEVPVSQDEDELDTPPFFKNR